MRFTQDQLTHHPKFNVDLLTMDVLVRHLHFILRSNDLGCKRLFICPPNIQWDVHIIPSVYACNRIKIDIWVRYRPMFSLEISSYERYVLIYMHEVKNMNSSCFCEYTLEFSIMLKLHTYFMFTFQGNRTKSLSLHQICCWVKEVVLSNRITNFPSKENLKIASCL